MTQTRTETRPPVPVGQAVGQAESALTRLLMGVLAETGVRRETYLALQRLAALGDAATRDRYVRDLGDWLDLDLWAAGELADSLAEAGLATAEAGTIRMSAAGAGLREKILGSAAAVTASLYETLDPADVETTIRTLGKITARAREMRSAAPPRPEGGI